MPFILPRTMGGRKHKMVCVFAFVLLAIVIRFNYKTKEVMNINCWADLAKAIAIMTPSEQKEPIRIIVDDLPISLAKEINRAQDVYVRPKGEFSSGYPKLEIETSHDPKYGILDVSNWERTMDKGDIFIQAY